MIFPILCLGLASLILSWLLTALMIRIAPRIGLLDKPGHRKIHSQPKPLGGGVAIFLAFALTMLGVVVAIHLNFAPVNDPNRAAYLRGAVQQTPLAVGLLCAMLALHILGLLDDRKPLGPFIKLIVQLAVAAALVIVFKDIRALTALGPFASITLTVLWIVAITNAFNFLDNMDGLSSGVAAVCTTSFFITTILIEQWFVAASLAILLGALLGFLCWNFPPAKIFMGDAGSLIVGFLLGVLTIRTTYLQPGTPLAAGWYSVFAPVIVLAVPLYDLIVVSIIRLMRGKSPFVGDTNHFSHRLVARGMSRRTAVLCIYLVTAATAIAAILLPHVQSTLGAILIFAQTMLILGVVAILEQHPLPDEK
ncbi:MAG TPA: MraY family glycosyltransferase [Tepidisphaeraceae bacterium]|jgi:UDP-GlcNAc:undecaprenyl-phosphate GlcNAc-1-phosphate transferase